MKDGRTRTLTIDWLEPGQEGRVKLKRKVLRDIAPAIAAEVIKEWLGKPYSIQFTWDLHIAP